MYSLELSDGTIIDNLTRLNDKNYSFQLPGNNSYEIYSKLTTPNLTLVMVYNDNNLEDILIEYQKHNFYCNNNIIEFRITAISEFEAAEKHRIDKQQRKRREWYRRVRMEESMDEKGW